MHISPCPQILLGFLSFLLFFVFLFFFTSLCSSSFLLSFSFSSILTLFLFLFFVFVLLVSPWLTISIHPPICFPSPFVSFSCFFFVVVAVAFPPLLFPPLPFLLFSFSSFSSFPSFPFYLVIFGSLRYLQIVSVESISVLCSFVRMAPEKKYVPTFKYQAASNHRQAGLFFWARPAAWPSQLGRPGFPAGGGPANWAGRRPGFFW